ncbi:MAG: hypothetical protein VKJ24_09375 [Synechococcales bacterium]|nr:hypothetical protein [Synechococcales bacterium]
MNNHDRDSDDDLMPEYDFSQGVQGKHYKAYRQGHSVTIHKIDRTIETQYFTLAEGAVMLDPDVQLHFQDSEAVNQALRMLIQSGLSLGSEK